jgi:hypothetical protein
MREFLLKSASVLTLFVSANIPAFSQTVLPAPTEGVIASPLPVQAANNYNNSSVIPVDGFPTPTPGTVVIHLNGRVAVGAVASKTSLDNVSGGGVPAAKLDPFSFIGFVRLYPGVDAMATNGLRYGASVELRQDFGPTTGSTANSGGSANSFSSTLFVRRAFAYSATDNCTWHVNCPA